jgi:hypothetical protein
VLRGHSPPRLQDRSDQRVRDRVFPLLHGH